MVPDRASLNCLGGPVLSCVMCTVMNRHRIEQKQTRTQGGNGIVGHGEGRRGYSSVRLLVLVGFTKSEEGKVGCRVFFWCRRARNEVGGM